MPAYVRIDTPAVYIVTPTGTYPPVGSYSPPPSEEADAQFVDDPGEEPSLAPVAGTICPRCHHRAMVLEHDPLRIQLTWAGAAVLMVVAVSLAVRELVLVGLVLLLGALIGLAWALPKLQPSRWVCLSCGHRGPWGERP